ncbi:transcription elongation factor GreB, partial [Escherichia coli]
LHAELRQLLTVERPKVTSEVSAAAAQGDRSENAEYIYGKKRLREIDRRLRFLKRRLDIAIVVEPREQTDSSRVYFGATVTLEDEDGKVSV